jgi:hypothetical protein
VPPSLDHGTAAVMAAVSWVLRLVMKVGSALA